MNAKNTAIAAYAADLMAHVANHHYKAGYTAGSTC